MLPWALPRRHSRRSRIEDNTSPATWARQQMDPRDSSAAAKVSSVQIWTFFYTEINWQGITGPGQVASRAKFCRDMRIQPKDMRSLESNFSGLTISVRGESIIINTDGFRALINPESVAMLNDPLVAYKEYQHLPVIKSSNEGLAFSRRQEFISNLLKGISRLNGIQRRAKKGEKSAYDIEYSFDLLALGSILDVIFGSLEEELHILKAAVRAL
ncbi:hypothetical protein Pst134EA_031274 [Puccinia striiformis f. sp. tritici]|uniref:uncharacterized protein n=1 Tax=Puccinia striiformis f. sp. tritici TaxID=168172 RepID=UPI002008BEFB|nr:uncharacterized protein Pst134EA_031274 [Puccinia striiformis f. sp. tritici]KAH9443398.1 hypothetical protein Pst134EA_031274 [Puccinia striiformis f. sp. tritici]